MVLCCHAAHRPLHKHRPPLRTGLATGSTPLRIYRELVRLHREEGLSFKRVKAFNLDKYYPMQPTSLQSYHVFMHENLFRHIDIEPGNVHIPRGDLPPAQVARCGTPSNSTTIC